MDSIPSWPFVVRNSRRSFFGVIALWTTLALHSRGCDLCAIYSAGGARGESRAGFHFTVAEEFIPFRTPQSEGHEVAPATPDYLDRSITHFVPAYNFSGRLGVGLNVPVIYRRFQRSDFRYSLTGQVFETNRVSEFDLGDIALVSRFTLFQRNRMKYGVAVNLLAGVKFPTGDTDRLKDEVEQTRIFDARQTPGTTHDPLGHSSSGIHQHDLSSGSGSFDGIFGLTLNSRWLRCFFNSQFQYYLRTEAESFQYGDDLIVSGGAGYYVRLDERSTLSVQAKRRRATGCWAGNRTARA
jgi:hypothetical protein